MAIYWPSATSSCRVDLLTASYSQVYNAVRCDRPGITASIATEIATDLWQKALDLRSATALMQQSATGVLQVIRGTETQVSLGTQAILQQVYNTIGSLATRVNAGIASQLQQQQQATGSIVDQVVGGIGDLLGDAASTVGGIAQRVSSAVGGVISQAGQAVGNVAGQVAATVGGLIARARDAVAAAVSTLTSTIGGLVTEARTAVGSLIDTVTAGVGAAVRAIPGIVGSIVETVRQRIADILREIGALVGAIADRVSGFAGAVLEAAGTVVEGVTATVSDAAATLGGFLTDPLQGIIGGFFHAEEPTLLGMADRLYALIAEHPDAPPELRHAAAEARIGGKPVPALVAAFVLPFVLGAVLGSAMQPFSGLLAQEVNAQVRPTLPSLGEAVQAVQRRLATEEYARRIGARLGYPEDVISLAFRLGETLPTVGDLIDWTNRGLIDEARLRDALRRLGYADDAVEFFVKARNVQPGPGDIVRFVVRESLPGQVAYEGPRGASVPGAFVERAKKVGLTEEDARSYWAAHWELPSITAAFDMFHRRIIDEATLRAYLKEADVAPEWVDRIIAVAYDPLTRVDVRRMYELGVLSADEVESAYLDLGYSPTNARRLRDFVVADAAASVKVAKEPERDLTRADLVGAYADGILTRRELLDQLQAIGYDPDEAGLIVAREDLRRARAERKAARDAVVEATVAGAMTRLDAETRLLALGLQTGEVEAALADIDRRLMAQVKRPTLAQLTRFRKRGIITDQEYRAELRALGYADRWVEAFARALDAGELPSA